MNKNPTPAVFTLWLLLFQVNITYASDVVADFFGFGYSKLTHTPSNNLSDDDKSIFRDIRDRVDEIWQKPDFSDENYDHYDIFILDPDYGDAEFPSHPLIDKYQSSGLHRKFSEWGNDAFANMWHPEIRNDIYRLNAIRHDSTQIMFNKGPPQIVHADDGMFVGVWIVDEDKPGTIFIIPAQQANVKDFIDKNIADINKNFTESKNTGNFRLQAGAKLERIYGLPMMHAGPGAGPERAIISAQYSFNGTDEELSKFYLLKIIEQVEIEGKAGLKLTKEIVKGEFSVNGLVFANIKSEEELSIFARALREKLSDEQVLKMKEIAKGLHERAMKRNVFNAPSADFYDDLLSCL